MKDSILSMGWILLLLMVTSTLAQDPVSVNAARQEMEERLKRITARLDEVEATNELLRRRLARQDEEIKRLQGELSRALNQSSTQESLKRLAKSIEEVDRKRLSDYEKIRTEVGNLGKILAEKPVPAVPVVISPPVPPAQPTPSSETGVDYVVAAGDTLSGIVQKFKKQGVNVTEHAIVQANPGLNPQRIYVGRKIFVPVRGNP